MKETSWRHHYLPRFYIKYFCDEKNLLWVYSKQKDRIETKQKSPKQIFFTTHGNSTNIDHSVGDFIETLYNFYESNVSTSYLRIKNDIDKFKDDNDLHVKINLLITMLLWRIPAYDNIVKQHIDLNYKVLEAEIKKKYKVIWADLDKSSKYKYLKTEAIHRILKSELNCKDDYIYFNYYEFSKNVFLLSDNPILIMNHPGYNFDVSKPIIFPLSNRKLYFRSDTNSFTFKKDMIYLMNLLLVAQANNYVANKDKKTLEFFVNEYRLEKAKLTQFKDDLKLSLFRRLNNK